MRVINTEYNKVRKHTPVEKTFCTIQQQITHTPDLMRGCGWATLEATNTDTRNTPWFTVIWALKIFMGVPEQCPSSKFNLCCHYLGSYVLFDL